MFGDVVDPSIKVGTKKWYTIPLSILTHTIGLGALIVVPLLATDILPTPQSVMAFVAAPPPPPPPANAPPPPPVEVNVNPQAAPIEAPREIKPEPPPVMRTVVGGISTGLPQAATGPVNIAPPPPPPPPAPVRVGGDVKAPTKIKDVPVVYPTVAKSAKVQGIVIIEAVISKTGSVENMKVLRGNPLLDQAALEAVRQWKYSVPTLNGTPVDVIMTVTVNFTLN